jgi:transcription elongation factor Elf1
MPRRPIDPRRPHEDWDGNNIAVTCPVCGKVYVVSGLIQRGERPRGERPCPICNQSRGRVTIDGEHAEVEWELPVD